MTSSAIATRNGDVQRRPVLGSTVGNNVMKSSSFGTVVVGKTVKRSAPVVVVVTATAVVVGATVVVAATVVVGARVVVAATVVVVPTTVVVVAGGVVVVVVGSRVVVVVGGVVVVVVGSMVVVVAGGSVVVVVDASIVVDVVLVVAGAVVVVTGAMIAPLLMERSWLPTEQFLFEHTKSMRRMWYGDPLMEEAEFPAPQSACDAMCPDHDSTMVGADAVK
jgi:hypothetical protein